MTRTISINGREYTAHDWTETPTTSENEPARRERVREARQADLLELLPGDVSFRCDHTLLVDSIFDVKEDGRTYMIVASGRGLHVAKPY